MSVASSRLLFALILTSTAACATSTAAGGGVPRSTSDVDHDTVPDVDDRCPYDPGAGADGCPVAAPTPDAGASTIETSVTPDAVVAPVPVVPAAPGPTTPPAPAPIPAPAPR